MNQLLKALPDNDLQQLKPHLEQVILSPHQVLYEADESISHVYFPNDGLVSLVVSSHDGIQVESSIVGLEGLVGAMAVLGDKHTITKAEVEIAGTAWQAPISVLRDQSQSDSALERALLRYMQVLYNQTAQSALCNRAHSVEDRFCRWMLVIRGRVQSEEFDLRPEFIADMLGLKTPKVLPVLAMFEKAGLIHYDHVRGHLTLCDVDKRAIAACECYKVLEEQFRVLDNSQW